jgi:hypothetical protein
MAEGDLSTFELVNNRFTLAEDYADNALETVETYIETIEDLLNALTMPNTSEITNINLPTINPIDYAAIPSFAAVMANFPTFLTGAPADPTLEDVPNITGDVPSRSFSFTFNPPTAPTPSFGTAPSAPTLSSISIPAAPSISFPTAPTLDNLVVPTPPGINIAAFTATKPTLTDPGTPTSFSFTEAAYNSDIRIPLFNKILDDIANGGTGLDVTVEADIYDRFLARQQAENDRLYQEIQNQFSATGFELPPGSYAARMMQVSNEISLKNDQASREITINQAELAQKNTHFTLEQARLLEQLLVEFYTNQQNRALQASLATAENAVNVYNAIVTRQNLLLEEYKTEAQVFETKIRAELAAIEAYRAQVEAVKASADVQVARVNIYNSQIAAVETMIKVYQTEMESARIQAEIQNLQISLFRTQTEAYATGVAAEKTKVDIYGVEVQAEATRADAFKTEVDAYEAEVRGKLGVIEAQRIKAANKIAENQQLIDKYRADIDRYRSEIESEMKTAQLSVSGYQASVAAYQAQTGAKEMEFRSRVAETTSQIELARANLEQARAVVESTTNAYVALKSLEVKATEGIMNTNAQLAASAMNAVNASASMGISSGWSYDGTKEKETTHHQHIYSHKQQS